MMKIASLRAAGLGVGLCMALIAGASASAAEALSLGDRVGLQAALQQHIDRQSVDGAYLHLRADSGEVGTLYPATTHPVIMRMGENFVLCYDFRDASGASVDVDFYFARKDASFVVFHTAVAEHALLKRLISEGKASRAD